MTMMAKTMMITIVLADFAKLFIMNAADDDY
jgi:hypothetical protein